MGLYLNRSWLVVALLGSVALGSMACSGRGIGEDELGASSTDDGAADPADGQDTSEGAGNTSTSGDASVDDDGSSDGGSDESSALDLPSSDPPDPCDEHLNVDQDVEQTCGLLHIDFEPQSAALSFGASCRLTAVAPCIAVESGPLYLESRAASDEGLDEEGAVLLSQARGVAVQAFLLDQGVAGTAMQVIVKGNLRAQQPAWDGDRRVSLLW